MIRDADDYMEHGLRYLLQNRREKLYAYGEAQAKKLGILEEDVPDLVRQTRQAIPRGR